MRLGSWLLAAGAAGAGDVCDQPIGESKDTVKRGRDKPIFIIFRRFLKVIFKLARGRHGPKATLTPRCF